MSPSANREGVVRPGQDARVNAPRIVDGVKLTQPMMTVLIAHASGERHVRVSEADTLRALAARRLIRFNRPHKPMHTIATPRGREVIAALLAQMADALSKG